MKLTTLKPVRLNGDDIAPGTRVEADEALTAAWIDKGLAVEIANTVVVLHGDEGPIEAYVVPQDSAKKSKKAK